MKKYSAKQSYIRLSREPNKRLHEDTTDKGVMGGSLCVILCPSVHLVDQVSETFLPVWVLRSSL